MFIEQISTNKQCYDTDMINKQHIREIFCFSNTHYSFAKQYVGFIWAKFCAEGLYVEDIHRTLSVCYTHLHSTEDDAEIQRRKRIREIKKH